MPAQKKLNYQEFWDRMKKATEQVDQWPEWEKGSPTNERPGRQHDAREES